VKYEMGYHTIARPHATFRNHFINYAKD